MTGACVGIRGAGDLALVNGRMGRAGADGIAIRDDPVSIALLELIIQLHRSGTALEAEIDLSLSMIAVDRHVVDDGVEGLRIQIAIACHARLNHGADLRFLGSRVRAFLAAAS